jgi:uncharacterized surface protein with fasciclin (FAS1) repeats
MHRTATRFRVAAALAVTLSLPLALTACGGSSHHSASHTKAAAAHTSPSATMSQGGGADGKPFGSACSAVPASGAGSFNGMAQDPVATAASHNPVLSTLVTAVKKAGLVDTLNSAQNITVFAPTNDAFAKIPKATLDKVLADKAMLTKILTYHVVGSRLTPAQLSSGGPFTTLEKGTLATSGSGTSYKVNGTANVVCGNVRTANATVYIVDSVLMPKK